VFFCSAPLLVAGCAGMQDAPRLAYQCPNDSHFEARLYQDMAFLESPRGFVRLARIGDGEGGAPRYRDDTVLVEFGLGLGGRLAALHYTGIPEAVYCERAPATQGAALPAVRAAPLLAPTPPLPPPPPDPRASVWTNVRTGAGPARVGAWP